MQTKIYELFTRSGKEYYVELEYEDDTAPIQFYLYSYDKTRILDRGQLDSLSNRKCHALKDAMDGILKEIFGFPGTCKWLTELTPDDFKDAVGIQCEDTPCPFYGFLPLRPEAMFGLPDIGQYPEKLPPDSFLNPFEKYNKNKGGPFNHGILPPRP